MATCMLTKLLRADQAVVVQPISWRRAGGPIAAAVPTTNVDTAGRSPDKVHTPEQQIAMLQARVTELERSLDRQVNEAKAGGYKAGEEAGRNQAAARLQPVLDKLAQSIKELGELKPKLRRDAETDLLKLALAIARKILHRELNIDPDSIGGLIKVAIDKIRAQEILRVRIHPQHQQIVQQIVAKLSTGAKIEVLPDPKLEVGGAIVETSRGDFDASIDLQLKEIERGLTDRLAHHR